MPRGFTWPPSESMLAAEQRCRRELSDAGVSWSAAPRQGRIVAPVVVASDGASLSLGGVAYRSAFRRGPHALDCQLALALEEFGPSLVELGVRKVVFGSIFRWSNVRVNGKTRPALSRHALGLAMDIVSVTAVDGRVAQVSRDYRAGDPLLHAIEDRVNASGRFRLLLTPSNDPVSHHDHFHLEAAVDYARPVATR